MRKEHIFDELLILKIKEGDKKAFELLVKRWNKKLLVFTNKYLHDFDASKDIVQDGWVSISKGLKTLKEPSKFSSWAFRIVYNKLLDYAKKEKRQQEATQQAHYENGFTEPPEELSIDKILEVLPATQKTILSLFYLEKQSIKQIADILNLSEGTVKSRIFYAREKLKKIINKSNYESYR